MLGLRNSWATLEEVPAYNQAEHVAEMERITMHNIMHLQPCRRDQALIDIGRGSGGTGGGDGGKGGVGFTGGGDGGKGVQSGGAGFRRHVPAASPGDVAMAAEGVMGRG